MRAIRFLFILSFFPSIVYSMTVEVYFSPKGGCADAIEKRIDSAKKEILVAVYTFTSSQLAWALVRAKKRGVDVKVILDVSEAENPFSKIEFLKNKGIEAKIDYYHILQTQRKMKKFPGKMHHKFAVIDEEVVITGSYNWTATAEEHNDEDCLIFTNAEELAKVYKKKFFTIWERN